MQLKLFIVPALIVLSVFLVIFSIKPEYDTLMQERAALEEKKSQVTKIETTKSNIGALTTNLNNNSELEDFSLRYYPETFDQERVIDAFNFMASQNGLVIKTMELKEVVAENKQDDSLGVGGPLTSIPTEGEAPIEGEALVSAIPVYQKPTPGSFVARVEAVGGYENAKSFLNRLSRMDRMSTIKLVGITLDKKEGAAPTEEVAPVGEQLVASFEARFDYIKPRSNSNALGIPVFEKTAFDYSSLEAEQSWVTTPVPPLNLGETGRANPFQ